MTKIALLADLHVREPYVDTLRTELEAVRDYFAERDVTHLFVLGDLVDGHSSPEDDRRHLETVHSIFADAAFPVTYLLGNHDTVLLDRERISDVIGQSQFYGTVETAESTVVYLDSTVGANDGVRGLIGPTQREWLSETLAQTAESVVLVHHPLGNFDVSGNPWFSEFPELAFPHDRKETLDVLDRHGNVAATFSGHIHRNGYERFFSIPHVALNAFSKEHPEKPFTGTVTEVTLGETIDVEVTAQGTRVASYEIS